MNPSLVIMSYFGPGDKAPGVRVERLARAARRLGCRVCIVYAADSDHRSVMDNGIDLRAFARTDPSAWRDRRRATLDSYGKNVKAGGTGLAWLSRRLARIVLQPDEMVMSVTAFERAAWIACQELQAVAAPVIVLASGPPWSTCIAGQRLARRRSIPLVLDLQDLWSYNPVARWPLLGRWLSRRWEQHVLRDSAGLIFVNPIVASRYEDDWPFVRDKPRVVAPIGFDGDVATSVSVPPSSSLTIGYFGTLYSDRDLGGLIRACHALKAASARPIVVWYGELLDDHPLRFQLASFVAGGTLEMHDSVAHAEALSLMRRCDILVTVPSPRYKEELTTKLYDYLSAGRPILGLCSQGSYLAEFLQSSGVGFAIPAEDDFQIRTFLERCMREGATLHPRQHYLRNHGVAAIDRALGELLTSVT